MASASSRHGWELITNTGVSVGIQEPTLSGATYIFVQASRREELLSSVLPHRRLLLRSGGNIMVYDVYGSTVDRWLLRMGISA